MDSTPAKRPQYASDGLRRYEAIFGAGFLSAGGLDMTRSLCAEIGIQPRQKVLDIGCGLGGPAILMAETYSVTVTGVDMEEDTIRRAQSNARRVPDANVMFRVGDVLNLSLGENEYDGVFSRETFLHIHQKGRLLQKIRQVLKPGGWLFFTDYGRTGKEPTPQFAHYIRGSDYDLLTQDQWTSLLTEQRFTDVSVDDRTDALVQTICDELEKTEQGLSDLPKADRDYLRARWESKITFCEAGLMRWFVARAVAPG